MEQNSPIRKKSISKKMKESTLELVLSSTSHGLPNIFRSKRTSLKLMWAILVLVSLSACSYFVFDNIINYLNYEYTTSINIIHEQQTEFPTLTFCSNPNQFGNKSIRNIIKFCRFSGDITFTFIPQAFFEIYLDGLYGNCFRFNSGKNMLGKNISIFSSKLAGYLFGLYMEIKLEPKNFLIIQIHNHTVSPMTLANRETFLSLGNTYSFKIEKKFTEKLELPYNECYKDIEMSFNDKTYINEIKKHRGEYNSQECVELCFSGFYLKYSNCGCQISNLYEVTNKCYFKANISMQNCTTNFLKNNENNNLYEMCKSFCPLECNSMEYEIITTVASNYLNDTVDLNIYYDALEYTLIREIPKTKLFDLISNIGGTLGLFIGVSFLSFIEIIEITFEIILIFLEHRITRRIH